MAGAIGRGLGRGVGGGVGVGVGEDVGDGVGEGDGVGDGVSDGVAGPALLVTTAGLDVAVPEQATTASSRPKIEPIRARRLVRTLASPIIRSVAS